MKLIIQINNTDRPEVIYELPCDFEETHFKNKWLARFYAAKERGDPISEPWAFYNLNEDWSDEHTLEFINEKIDICNSMVPGLFNTHLTDINDQDTLNYLHSVFEKTHGKLDEWKTNPLFNTVLHPIAFRESLSHINQTIHRCEGIDVNTNRKIRVVYFDLPKTELYADKDYNLFTTTLEFGGVYVHYTDVGKTIEELAMVDDTYHFDVVPYLHYSADFSIKFNDSDGVARQLKEQEYIEDNREILMSKGYAPDDVRLTSGSIKIAQLEYESKEDVLAVVARCNNIYDVIIK